jgi:hypothetical protein
MPYLSRVLIRDTLSRCIVDRRYLAIILLLWAENRTDLLIKAVALSDQLRYILTLL